jgi:hypothetical protein
LRHETMQDTKRVPTQHVLPSIFHTKLRDLDFNCLRGTPHAPLGRITGLPILIHGVAWWGVALVTRIDEAKK